MPVHSDTSRHNPDIPPTVQGAPASPTNPPSKPPSNAASKLASKLASTPGASMDASMGASIPGTSISASRPASPRASMTIGSSPQAISACRSNQYDRRCSRIAVPSRHNCGFAVRLRRTTPRHCHHTGLGSPSRHMDPHDSPTMPSTSPHERPHASQLRVRTEPASHQRATFPSHAPTLSNPSQGSAPEIQRKPSASLSQPHASGQVSDWISSPTQYKARPSKQRPASVIVPHPPPSTIVGPVKDSIHSTAISVREYRSRPTQLGSPKLRSPVIRMLPSDAKTNRGPPESPKHTPRVPSPSITTNSPSKPTIGSAVNSRSPLLPSSCDP